MMIRGKIRAKWRWLLKQRRLIGILGAMMVLVAMLCFLWYPLVREGRLGLIARGRRQVMTTLPWLEPTMRRVLLLPKDNVYDQLQQEITKDVEKKMKKIESDSTGVDQGKDQEIIQAAVGLLLYLRPEPESVAFPVDPDQSPLETANVPEFFQVSQDPEKRLKRNLLLQKYLKKYSRKDNRQLVEDVYRSERGELLKSNFNPLRYLELYFHQQQVKRRMEAALGHVKRHLDAAGASVYVTVNPEEQDYDPQVAILDIQSKSFASFVLERVRLEYSAPEAIEMRLYRDRDEDGRWGAVDELIGTFSELKDADDSAGNLKLELDGLSELVYAAMEVPEVHGVDPYYGIPMFHKHVEKRFFLVANRPPELLDAKFKLVNRITGKRFNPNAVQFVNDETFRYHLDTIMTPEEFVAKHPQFGLQSRQLVDENEKPTVLLPPGRHTFDKMVVVPETVTLRLLPGTTLRFLPGVSLVSYAPVVAEGRPSAPIRFVSATGEPWGTLAIVNTKEQPSLVRYVVVENGAPARVNGIIFSGALAAHYADITITDSVFRNNHGDDGVNVKYSNAEIERNQFLDNEFDGLDLDVCQGQVRDNTFEGNGNDGLDVSWNEAVIEDNLMRHNSDKCLSIGEKSTAPVRGNTLEGCVMGVAVKDQSDVVIEDNQIKGNQQGVAVYQKKPIFGGAVARLRKNRFEGNEQDIWTDEKSEVINE